MRKLALTPIPFCRLLAAGCLLLLVGCATLPAAVDVEAITPDSPVLFRAVDGPVPHNQGEAILRDLRATAGDTAILHRHLEIEQKVNAASPLVLGNRLRLLQDGPATYEAMFAAILEARDHINLETYIFEDDDIGRRFADLLLERQAAGVQVNLIYDSVGCLNTPREFFARLEDGGIRLLEYNPVNPLARHPRKWRLNNRDHRKLLVVDGRIAFIGGINISAAYSSGPSRGPSDDDDTGAPGWRDTHLQIEGPVVAEFQQLFLDTWRRQQGRPLAERVYFPPLGSQGDEIVRAIGSRSDDPDRQIYVTLLSAIGHAERYIHITNAYFAPDPQLLRALTDAAQRGVEVTLILPSRTDAWPVFHAGRSHYKRLLKAGVGIYERRDVVMHAKTVIIDGVWSTIGSTNLDWRSFLHNDELNAVILSRNFSRQMEEMFAADLAESDRIELKRWKRRPLLLRFKEWSARLVAYWL